MEDNDLALVVQPQYRTASVPALAGGLGVGVAAGWFARTVRRRRG